MTDCERTIQEACDNGRIPGTVVVSGNASGSFYYARAFNARSPSDTEPVDLESVMGVASCTKLMTTVAALQCVDRGHFKLDDDVTTVLPELKDVNILKGFTLDVGGEPILVPNTKKITLRHLLTHSSGLACASFNSLLSRYQSYVSKKPNNRSILEHIFDDLTAMATVPVPDTCVSPLLFEPGEGWEYSTGIDWAGEMVARVTNMSLEEHLRRHVWEPLQVDDATFHPSQHENVKRKLATYTHRSGSIDGMDKPGDPIGKIRRGPDLPLLAATTYCHGGAGAFTSMLSYFKLLRALISPKCPLLSEDMTSQLFTPQLEARAKRALDHHRQNPEWCAGYGGIEKGVEADWGFAGMLCLGDAVGGRMKFTAQWAGLFNLWWWMDRESGLVGIYGCQFYPFEDPEVRQLFELWRAEMYKLEQASRAQ